MARVKLVPYMDDMVWKFAEAVGEEGPMPLVPEDVERLKVILGDPDTIMRGILDAETGEFVGYCEVHDKRKDDWELGLTILRRHWRKGYGRASMLALMDEVHRTYGRGDFIVRITPDNEPSVRLFQGLGATPRGLRRSIFMLTEEQRERFASENHGLINDFVVEMAGLFGVQPEDLLGRSLVFDLAYDPVDAVCGQNPKVGEGVAGGLRAASEHGDATDR